MWRELTALALILVLVGCGKPLQPPSGAQAIQPATRGPVTVRPNKPQIRDVAARTASGADSGIDPDEHLAAPKKLAKLRVPDVRLTGTECVKRVDSPETDTETFTFKNNLDNRSTQQIAEVDKALLLTTFDTHTKLQ